MLQFQSLCFFTLKKNYDQKIKSLVNDDNEWEDGK